MWQAQYKAKHGVKYGKRTEEGRQKRAQEKARWNAANPESVKASWARDAVKATARRQAGARKRQALRKLAKAARGQGATSPWYQGCCPECGDLFVSKHMAKFCSQAHKHASRSHLRRVIERECEGAFVSRFAIYQRDAWTCQLCGDPVNRAAHYLDDDAPSLDHLVPVTLGGQHIETNLQCAHRYCNSVKGAREWAEVA